MAKMRVPERGSEEERRYYLTKEGLKDFDSYKEFDWRRALELLFEDAPDVNWQDCSANDFKELRDKGVITEEECDHRDLHSFPTRRSSDLVHCGLRDSLYTFGLNNYDNDRFTIRR